MECLKVLRVTWVRVWITNLRSRFCAALLPAHVLSLTRKDPLVVLDEFSLGGIKLEYWSTVERIVECFGG